MRPDLEDRKSRQREEGKLAMAEYRQHQQDTLARMQALRAQRLSRAEPHEIRRERRIDETLDQTFPASDPPAFVAG
jgi:hypothetical protein